MIKYSCSEANDACVDAALDPSFNWMVVLSYIPLIKNSPAAPFLTGYYPDGVGMSAVDTGIFNDMLLKFQLFQMRLPIHDMRQRMKNYDVRL